jgi:hypothetical protein
LGKEAIEDIFRCTDPEDGLEGLKCKSEIGGNQLWGCLSGERGGSAGECLRNPSQSVFVTGVDSDLIRSRCG